MVDRRLGDDSGAYQGEPNRVKLQADLDGTLCEATSHTPALVQVERSEDIAHANEFSDVLVITRTPGFDLLPKLMMSRIWGVKSELMTT